MERLPLELDRLAARIRVETGLDVAPEQLIWERAEVLGLGPPPNGQTSRSGVSRLLPTIDGWMALTLSRPWDMDALAAWMGHDWEGDSWEAAAAAGAKMTATEAVERAQLLGVAAAVVGGTWSDEQAGSRGQNPPTRPWLTEPSPATKTATKTATNAATKTTNKATSKTTNKAPKSGPPLVVDLSALWAGPLAGRLLAEWGADVIKVEDPARPDGFRVGALGLYRRLNAGKQHRSFSLVEAMPLLQQAEVIITSARPRVWQQLGNPQFPGTWVQISGYGRTGPWRDRVAFGDDAAVAGGLYTPGDPPGFVGDAIADPLTGMVAAWAALVGLQAGGGLIVDVAMREVAGWVVREYRR
jgi:crotonobetainyl-CoA:carnitine CoA-transferase CaiB-like acyl-CoA transferase